MGHRIPSPRDIMTVQQQAMISQKQYNRQLYLQ